MRTDVVQEVYQDFLCQVTVLSGCNCDATDPDDQVTVSSCVRNLLFDSELYVTPLPFFSEVRAAPLSVSGSGVRPGKTAGVCPQQSL